MPHKQLQRTVNVGTRLERGVSVHMRRAGRLVALKRS
jgi:hypothetical protein